MVRQNLPRNVTSMIMNRFEFVSTNEKETENLFPEQDLNLTE